VRVLCLCSRIVGYWMSSCLGYLLGGSVDSWSFSVEFEQRVYENDISRIENLRLLGIMSTLYSLRES
jgi:hypothetical protein